MLLQINEQQPEQLEQYQNEQNVTEHLREVEALDHELGQVEKLDAHGDEKHHAQANHDDVLRQFQVLPGSRMCALHLSHDRERFMSTRNAITPKLNMTAWCCP